MNRKTLTGLIIFGICIMLLAVYAGSRRGTLRATQKLAPNEAAEAGNAIGTRRQSPAALREIASSNVDAIRSSRKEYDTHMSEAVDGNTSDSEAAAAQETAVLEQKLLDSMTSLTRQIEANPEFVQHVLELLQNENDPQMMQMLAQAIGEAAKTLGDKFPYDKLLKMASSDSSMPRRQAALIALGYMSDPPWELQLRVAEISRTAPINELRMTAIDSMGSWAANNAGLKEGLSELLVETRSASTDIRVRGMVIQTIGNMDAPLTPEVLMAMSDALINEKDAHNRSLAAVALGSGTSPENMDAVLKTLESAYLAEQDLSTQRHIITQITKAARGGAEEYLKRLPTSRDPLLAMDVNDYIEIVGKVDPQDWTALFNMKYQRDIERGTTAESQGDDVPAQ